MAGRRARAAAPRVLGVDEAGRGSVFGPLVVGGYAIDEASLPRLAELGVRDSKELTPANRERLDRELRTIGRAYVRTIPPARIDRSVRHGGLNDLEASVFAELLRTARAERAYVDACDPVAARFGRTVARLAGVPASRVVARHHADRDLPVVSAASIVAKVARDAAIAALRERSGRPLGTGYPSDPETRRCLTELLADGRRLPEWVRASWATVDKLKPSGTARALESFG